MQHRKLNGIMEFRGMDPGDPHPPLRPMTQEEAQRLKGELETLGLL